MPREIASPRHLIREHGGGDPDDQPIKKGTDSWIDPLWVFAMPRVDLRRAIARLMALRPARFRRVSGAILALELVDFLLDVPGKLLRRLPVDQQVVLLLILANGVAGLGAVLAVRRTRVEAQFGQADLHVP